MVFVIGDTHGDFEKLISIKLQNILTKDDYLIVLGDFGFVWDKTYLKNIKMLEDFKFTILFLDGNHCNFTLLDTFSVINKFNGKVSKLGKNIYWLKRGEIYNIDNKKILTIGGANSIDKHRRVSNVSWWEQENLNRDEINNAISNLEKNNFEVDYVLTHTCKESEKEKIVTNFDNCVTSQALTNLFKFYDIKYKHWYFGHFHIDEELDEKHTAVYEKLILLK